MIKSVNFSSHFIMEALKLLLLSIYTGDSSFDAITTVEALRLNPKQDYPVLIVLELVGNDVCNG